MRFANYSLCTVALSLHIHEILKLRALYGNNNNKKKNSLGNIKDISTE